ncbi:MAG: alpha/beta fold hydrolase [Isosphaeraceae bacterium]
MSEVSRHRRLLLSACLVLATLGPGCASMRMRCGEQDLRPCSREFAVTSDGWHLGIRRIRPERPDPDKLPVVLCHGLGLNGTFWTITGGDHLPNQLAARGYEVFIVDMRGSGASHRDGLIGKINRTLRETPFLELDEGRWTMDDEANYDVPAILDHVQKVTGKKRVNWVGHSLGGMLMFAYLETSDRPDRIANFVAMGCPVVVADAPNVELWKANRGLRMLLRVISTARIARPMMIARPPGLERIDKFYYSVDNVDKRTVSRFYGYTLENPGRGALKQLERYVRDGHLVSADGAIDYAMHLDRVKTPTVVIAGEGDILADMPSSVWTFERLASTDKTLLRFGKREGDAADYGHCDLVWSRHAPQELFPPVVEWLDRRQPGPKPSAQASPAEQRLDADPRPSLQVLDRRLQTRQSDEARLR